MNLQLKLKPIVKMEMGKKLTLADKVKVAMIESTEQFANLSDNMDCFDGLPFFFGTVNEIATTTVKRFPDLITHKMDNPRFKGNVTKCFNQVRAEVSSLFVGKKASKNDFSSYVSRNEGIKNLYAYAPLGEPDSTDQAIEFTFNEMYDNLEEA